MEELINQPNIMQKIDAEALINQFRLDKIYLKPYLKEVWKDLSSRGDEVEQGVNLHTFFQVSY